MDNAIELSLKTWYPTDHLLHNEPLHPALGLAGEAGELLDLYKKERFKDGVSWWDCVHCGYGDASHTLEDKNCPTSTIHNINEYTPKILDELGDLWYYLRILAYQLSINDFGKLANEIGTTIEEMLRHDKEVVDVLTYLLFRASNILRDVLYISTESEIKEDWFFAYIALLRLLNQLDFTLDQVTESNWQKLKDGDNHGWKSARESSYRS